MKLSLAGATHACQIRVLEQIRMTLKTPLVRKHTAKEIMQFLKAANLSSELHAVAITISLACRSIITQWGCQGGPQIW
jgi:hypothetical protein